MQYEGRVSTKSERATHLVLHSKASWYPLRESSRFTQGSCTVIDITCTADDECIW